MRHEETDPTREMRRPELDRLPHELRPERDLWPTIAARLAPRPAAGWRRWIPRVGSPALLRPVLATLAVAALVGTGFWLGRTKPPALETAAVPSVARAGMPAISPTAALVDSSHAEDGLLQLRRDLLESIERRRHELSPESVQILEEALAVMDAAIGEVRLALARDPGNVYLNRRLAAQYQREVQLLKALHRI